MLTTYQPNLTPKISLRDLEEKLHNYSSSPKMHYYFEEENLP